jgi:hypothetical protein
VLDLPNKLQKWIPHPKIHQKKFFCSEGKFLDKIRNFKIQIWSNFRVLVPPKSGDPDSGAQNGLQIRDLRPKKPQKIIFHIVLTKKNFRFSTQRGVTMELAPKMKFLKITFFKIIFNKMSLRVFCREFNSLQNLLIYKVQQNF